MKFYHFISPRQVHGFMRGASLGAFSTFCPTPNLISHGVLTLHCLYERPLAFRLSQENPFDPAYVKMAFEERRQSHLCPSHPWRNRFTLKLLTRREESQFTKTQCLPNGAALVLWIPKNWEVKQNRPLVGGTLTLVMDGLVKIFQNNLRQVIDARRPHNAELYPTALSKLEPARNIHIYTSVYLQGYRKRMERMKDPKLLTLMNGNALSDLRREEAALFAFQDVTRKLGELVGFYQQGQVSKGLEEVLVQDVSALPRGKLKGSYL